MHINRCQRINFQPLVETQKYLVLSPKTITLSMPCYHKGTMRYLYSIKRIANGARCGRCNTEGLVFLEAVSQQTVDGTVVIVCICL